ncbi:hypothetical protein AKJ43_03735 [candidate division MSBL1 archaeon SCGC-AAA261D19]|uniref:Uncharacterized protein n=1 Tax=candidate division MSBL1 archaeon SCGC-AAA261D19 TaxID=1698273 RepID=A0A133V3K2_9EURY|nr:hypothetical protein AKJ43_03735 [candidate division MSBL1 archaeon SCGC-AAA261D19]
MWQEYREISNDHFTVIYALNTGGNKPLISAPSGDELISVNGFKSSIQINNSENRSFWNHTFKNVVEGTTVVRHNMLWDNYQLMQRATLEENTVIIDYRVKSCTGKDNFELTLNLWHEYQENTLLKIDNACINADSLEENGEENKSKPTYVVTIRTEPQPDNIKNASYWVVLTYSFENILVDEAWGNSIVRLTISYSSWEEKAEVENLL